MKTPPRWIKSLLAEAAACKTKLPWERGLRRAAFVVRRTATATATASATASATGAPRIARSA